MPSAVFRSKIPKNDSCHSQHKLRNTDSIIPNCTAVYEVFFISAYNTLLFMCLCDVLQNCERALYHGKFFCMIYYLFPKIVLRHSKSAVKIANNILSSFTWTKWDQQVSLFFNWKVFCILHISNTEKCHTSFFISKCLISRLVTQKSPARIDRACANRSMFPRIKRPFCGKMTYTERPFRGKMA